MREYPTIMEVDERGRMLMPLAMRRALGIENKRALIEIRVTVVNVEKEDSVNPSPANASESLPALA